MKSLSVFSLFIGILLFIAACGGETDVVESGTYAGTIQKVVPEESEIYVQTEDGKTLELYFIDETTLTRNGTEVPFDELQEGQEVEVEVEKVGKRLDPLAVRILE
jgi:hypothetical protein